MPESYNFSFIVKTRTVDSQECGIFIFIMEIYTNP